MEKQEEWETTWVEAYIWWCGDEYCNCAVPVIERITPNRKAGCPWINRERLWEGTFETDGEGRDAQRTELEEAAEEYGIMLNENHYGRRLGA